jgi:hypothetical protein
VKISFFSDVVWTIFYVSITYSKRCDVSSLAFCLLSIPLHFIITCSGIMVLSFCLNDDSLGPSVRGCRGDFDFTIKFERLFLAIIPTAIFVALSLSRVALLLQKPRIVGAIWLQFIKLVRNLIRPLHISVGSFYGSRLSRSTRHFSSHCLFSLQPSMRGQLMG